MLFRSGRVQLASLVAVAVGLAGAALAPTLGVALPFMVVAGMGEVLYTVANQTLVQLTAPAELRERLIGRRFRELIAEMSRWRPGPPTDPFNAHRYSLRLLAMRWLSLTDEIEMLDQQLTHLVETTAPELDRKSTRLNSSHIPLSRMPSSA